MYMYLFILIHFFNGSKSSFFWRQDGVFLHQVVEFSFSGFVLVHVYTVTADVQRILTISTPLNKQGSRTNAAALPKRYLKFGFVTATAPDRRHTLTRFSYTDLLMCCCLLTRYRFNVGHPHRTYKDNVFYHRPKLIMLIKGGISVWCHLSKLHPDQIECTFSVLFYLITIN